MQPTDHSTILDNLGFRTATKLGVGINSTVYQVDENRIVKIGLFSGPEIKPLKDFLDTLACSDLPFQTPRIFESGEMKGQFYTIERLVPGAALRDVYPTLSEAKKERCIREILDFLDVLHNIELPGPFGERLLGDNNVTDVSWGGFLRQKCLQARKVNTDALQADFSEIDNAVDLFLEEVALLPAPMKPVLVHGDLFFPNIMASREGRITGIIDFSDLTLAGDPMMDKVGLAIFAREEEGRELINQLLQERFGEEFSRLRQLYSVYYAFRFSGCQSSDPDTYNWCLQEFSRYISSS